MSDEVLVILSFLLMIGYPIMTMISVFSYYRSKYWELYGIVGLLMFVISVLLMFVVTYRRAATNLIDYLIG